MAKKYILHRISHEYGTSQELLKNGYLSIGYSRGTDIYEAALTGDWETYAAACDDVYRNEAWWTPLKRKQPWRFLTLSVGDIVVVPLPYGEFSIYEVCGTPLKISDFDLSVLDNKEQLSMKDGFLYNGDEFVDLGFLLPVKPIKEHLSREGYADAKLTSRMKFPQANTGIDDISTSVEQAIAAETPINFYDSVIESIAGEFLKTIKSKLNPNKFEKLIKWFMSMQGFDAEIVAKNESGKENYADADVVAANNLLKLIIYIQAKFHEDISGSWAVEQVARYSEQKGAEDDATYIRWVISTADDFSEDAKINAIEKGVRLIDGPEFARMLINAGVNNINEAFKEAEYGN